MTISKNSVAILAVLSFGEVVGVGEVAHVSASTATSQNLLTDTSTDQITNQVNREFANLKDSDKVTPQSAGGYIYSASGVLDSTAVTVAQAKATIVANYEASLQKVSLRSIGIVALSASYPVTAKALSPGDTYYSNAFSGSGWNYSGYKFYNTSGSHNMLWENVNASGQVMDAGGTVLKYLGADASFVSVYNPYSIYMIYGIQNAGSSGAFYVVTGQ
ncbi:hypothetical protein [Lactococcus kimchii]|uniref:hypothetical protein n=1 Tax=Lactococcus sp. S-13 TaxID=2507158 RepID=UPI001022D9B0|nr:hypothetical protein [Lactococcus sp. S-13]RZI49173.1 hypothetical protein EQJ87_06820 [Lactococcus sp. S-13]